jgi:hypothetical protein
MDALMKGITSYIFMVSQDSQSILEGGKMAKSLVVLSPLAHNQTKMPHFTGVFSVRILWLGRQDSNLRMLVPKTSALPLGHAPLFVMLRYAV